MKFFLLFTVLFTSFSFAQGNLSGIALYSSSRGKYAVETYSKGKKKKDFQYIDSLGEKSEKAYASVSYNKPFQAYFRIDTTFTGKDSLTFLSRNSKKVYPYIRAGDKITLLHTGISTDELLLVYYKKQFLYAAQLSPISLKTETITIVPLLNGAFQLDSVERGLNLLMQATGKSYNINLQKPFLLKNFPETRLFKSPSEAKERFTAEMRYVRDAYLKKHPQFRGRHLVFIVPGFTNKEINSYAVHEKTVYFLQNGNSIDIVKHLFNELLGSRESGINLDKTGYFIPHEYWRNINKEDIVYSYFDEYEDIPAATGIVAYYFWKEDALGNIILPEKGTRSALTIIKRPYKRNTFSYHLQLNHFWMWTIFEIKSYPFNLLHLLGIILITWAGIYGGRKLRKWIKAKWRFPRLFRFTTLPIIFAAIVTLNILVYLLVSLAYSLYEVNSGNIEELSGMSIKAAEIKLRSNIHPRKIEEAALSSEILVEANNEIELRQRSSVLYFEATIGDDKNIEKLRCTDASNELKTKHLPKAIKAKNHYFVIHYVDDDGTELKEEVYNFLGVNITASLKAKDPARRILVFVNGYRPTSLGSSFEQHVYDVKKNGLEFPDSYNRLYNFDRYQYWQPWNNIDQRFVNVFSPTETYYADGHFSVSTSNYRSILNFSSASNSFPKRCKKGKPHHCFYTSTVNSKVFGSNRKKSLKIINYRSNRSGFRKRYENGKVAGRNLLAVLNELPNSSENDTLYLVAHSMGYAYSLGIVEVLKGKINFGTFIIIAPENASAGKVDIEEWNEIWQYGSNLDGKYPDQPCLQDGVAPQHAAKNLPYSKRVFIPKNLYTSKGFFDSHFIGYYTWIFDIPKGKKGYIKRH